MVELIRVKETDKQTLGQLYLDGEFLCFTLELPWKDNNHNISCIPVGDYKVVKRWSKHHHTHFHITNVENRSYILIHKGNYYSDIRGCVLVGSGFKDLNKDNELDVINSTITMKMLLDTLPDSFDLKIEDRIND